MGMGNMFAIDIDVRTEILKYLGSAKSRNERP
jgi:hypothetical protein